MPTRENENNPIANPSHLGEGRVIGADDKIVRSHIRIFAAVVTDQR